MFLRTSVLAFAVSFAVASSAQQAATSSPGDGSNPPAPEIYRNPNAQPQQIFYKWYSRGRAHYAKYAPRGVKNVIKINGQGMLVSERPDNNTFAVLRPVRPATPNAQNANGSQPLPEGTITREQRCATARKDLDTLGKPKVFQDDGKGNLVPLSADEISERSKMAQGIIDQFCNPQPSVPTVGGSRPPAAGSRPSAPGALPPPAPPRNPPPQQQPPQQQMPGGETDGKGQG